ncbi:hypothetical protein HH214_08870 [Mucilaginibacter robiniae]|uniref:Uncharacterized protein n=1 Tax=Mucilaginibacter robiniae TaxID=2728022 RepID=A0A7L5DYW5_9SPHI|nr:hypothetical protein [Mucilaginibacter robiniae]QJD95981.1 hypothetical protein HH214_08870 [Mucilaginibacter robiniae]
MNIALGALVILLLMLPALFFRLGITSMRLASNSQNQSASFSSESVGRNFINLLSKLNFSETLFFFSIVPIVQHLLSILIINAVNGEIDYQLMLNVLSSQKDVIASNKTFNHELTGFLCYIVIESGIGYGTGLLLIHIIGKRPELYDLLTGENFYLRLFAGYFLPADKRKDVDLILVDIVSETKEVTVIYSGFLEKFDIVPDKNELAYVTLSGARRRDLRKFSKVEEQPAISSTSGSTVKVTSYENDSGDMILIPGKYFTIPGNKISNVNVNYMKINTVTLPGGQSQQTITPIA